MTLAAILLVALIGIVVYGVWLAGELGIGPRLFRARQPEAAESDQEPAGGVVSGDPQ